MKKAVVEFDLETVKFLKVAEAAAYMRVSKMTVYRLIERKELMCTKVGRSFRVPSQSILDYLSKNTNGTAE